MRLIRLLLGRLCIAAGIGILFALTATVPARADSILVASDPQPRSELTARPGYVTLVFQHDVDVSLAKILVLDSRGQNATVGRLIVEGTNVTTQLTSELQQDTYTVMYRIDRPDGQPQGGSFQFAYGRGRWTTVEATRWSGQSAEPSVLKNPNPKGSTAAPTPTDVPTERGPTSPTMTPVASESTTTSATAAPVPPGQGGSVLPWVLGIGLLAAVAGVGAWLFLRNRKA